MRGILRKAVIGTAAVVCAIAVVVAFVLTTARGARWALKVADATLPGTLVVEGIDGSLAQGLRLVNLRYADAHLRATFGMVEARAHWSALLDGRLVLERLAAEDGRIELGGAMPGDAAPDEARSDEARSDEAPSDDAAQSNPFGDASTLERFADDVAVHAIRADRVAIRGLGSEIALARLRASLAGPALAVRLLEVHALGGTLTVRGNASLEAWSGHLSVDYAGVDPHRIDQRVRGDLAGRADVAFSLDPPLQLAITGAVDGEVDARPVDGSLIAGYAAERLTIERAELELDDGRVEAAGSIGSDVANLRFSAQLPRLSTWYPPAAGAVDVEGRISGGRQNPAVALSVEARDLALADASVPRITELTIDIEGTRARHTVRVDAVSEGGRLSAASTQAWDGAQLHGTLDDASMALARVGTWMLIAPAEFAVGAAPEAVELTSACLSGPQGGRLCASIDGRRAALEARGLPSALSEPCLPAEVDLLREADADVELDWRRGLRGSLRVDVASLGVTARVDALADLSGADDEGAPSPAPLARAEIADLKLRAALEENRLTAELEAAVAKTRDLIEGALELEPPTMDGMLDARLSATLSDLALADALVDGIEALEGVVTAELSATGTPSAPALNGALTVESLRAALPPLGIEVSDGRLRLDARGAEEIALGAALCSGGCVTADGSLALDSRGGAWRLTAAIAGHDFELAALPELAVTVSPDLDIAVTPDVRRATGTLGVPAALIVIEDVPRSAIRPAEETVVHGPARDARARETGLPVALELDLEAELGAVRFEGLGLAVQLDGQLEVEQTSAGPTLVRGTAVIESGTYSAYGQELTIERGQLIFTGAADNPSLDIRATREVDGALVGLTITGTARDPRSVVFSEPVLSDSEALARLVTGRSLSDAEPADAEALERAALGLGLRRALPTLDRLGQNLGLDELGVGATPATEGAIVAGKQLGSDVYLRYKHGLFDDFAGFELVYRITERFRLRAETGTSQSIDLIYEVDDSDPFALDDPSGVD